MSKITEIKKVTIEKEVTTHFICDSCGAKTEADTWEGLPSDWYGFRSSHNAWGNDSVDSVENHDVCSGGCYIKRLAYCVEDLEEYKNMGAKIDEKSWYFVKKLI